MRESPHLVRHQPVFPGRSRLLLASIILVLATVAAYRNTFSAPFIFDDIPTIEQNLTIRHLWPLWKALLPPTDQGLTVNGRPLVNLSLAANYAAGGLHVRGYHLANLAIHLLAGLTLFGIVRRSLLQPPLIERFGAGALPLALLTALIWTLHPLQTEAVTYVSQRAESLAGLCYLLTLYAVICGVHSPHRGRWHTLAVIFCLAGMAAKEVMVSAPLIVLLYDRTFVAGSFRRAWHERRALYAGLASTWLLLAWLMAGSGGRGGTAGFGIGLSWTAYASTQFCAIAHYFRLALWPFPLVLDYGGATLEHDMTRIVPCALLVLALAAATIVALRRRPVLGFLGAWFFSILAPTSSVVPLADTVFEHRMYLPLAALVVLVVAGLARWTGSRGMSLLVLVAVALALLTARRNEDYRSELAIWSDTVAKQPGNARAQYTLGSVLAEAGQPTEAIEHDTLALRLNPSAAQAHNNLGNVLVRLNRLPEAVEHYEAALQLQPRTAETHNNLGNALVRLGRTTEAIAHYEEALRLKPGFADAHGNLGNVFAQQGHLSDAIAHYESALQADPDFADAHGNLATALMQSGRLTEALPHYQRALQLRPNSAEAHYNLGTALAFADRLPEAIERYEEALRLQPDYPAARANLTQVQRELQARAGK